LGGRGALSATYFDDLYFDMIGSGANYVYYNIGSVVADGAELSAAYHASPRFDCLVNYTYTWTKQNNGLPQPRVPEDLYSLSLQYRCTDTLNFDLNGEYVGKRYDMDYLSNPMLSPVPESLSSYTLINLAVQYKVRPNYKLFARIDNLTNVDYETIYSYRTPGRGIYGGITAQL